MDYKNWFESRGLRTLDYQLDILENKLPQSLAENQKPTVLAACPSAGKTLMSIAFLDSYLQDNPDHRVLVLTHGTTILRSQYLQVLKESKPGFTFEEVTSGQDVRKTTAQVVVCLPHAFDNKRKCPHFNLLIVDEAHQLYFAEKRVKSVIKRVRPQKQILLTGTPSPFIRRKYPVIPVTVNHLLEVGMVEDVLVELASSTYNFTEEDYNEFYELKERTHIQEVDTRATLNGLLQLVEDRLTSVIKQYPKLYAGVKNVTGWSASFSALHKTMFACKSQEQARQVARYFQEKGIDTALSISDNDIDSAEIERFKNDNHCTVLIVVGRGILGFNLPELENVVDMTCSHNIDRLFQLMCRVIRKHPQGRKKLYFKVVPHHLEEYFYHVMNCVVCLTNEELFLKYNGKNFLQLKIPTMLQKRERVVRNGKEVGKKRGKIRPVMIEGLPAIQLMNDILHKTHGDLNSYAYTTMQAVRSEFLLKIKHQGYWTKKRCKEEALRFDTRSEFSKGAISAYGSARNNGWLEECCSHMPPASKPNGYWTKKRCEEDALRFDTHKEWRKNSPVAYITSVKNGWMDDVAPHQTFSNKPAGYWTLALCLEESSKYNTLTEWSRGHAASYVAARKAGYSSRCTGHMEKADHPHGHWTEKRYTADAAKYNSRNKWKKNSRGASAACYRDGNMDKVFPPHPASRAKKTSSGKYSITFRAPKNGKHTRLGVFDTEAEALVWWSVQKERCEQGLPIQQYNKKPSGEGAYLQPNGKFKTSIRVKDESGKRRTLNLYGFELKKDAQAACIKAYELRDAGKSYEEIKEYFGMAPS